MLEPTVPKQKPHAESDNEPHVLYFNSWLTADGPGLAALVDAVFDLTPPLEITPGRKHRADAEGRRKLCITALTANLCMVTLNPAEFDGLAVSLRNLKRSRYDRPGFNADVLRAAIEQLHDADLITVQDPVFKEKRTVVIPLPRLLALINEMNVGLSDIRQAEGRETIELWAGSSRQHNKVLVDYTDDERTNRLRAEMIAINEMLNAADIRLGGEPMGPIHVFRIFQSGKLGDRQMFDRHGRLYGGFWEHLSKDKRYLLTMGGEPVADLDFVSMFVQLAYCRVGVSPSVDDLYAIPGLEGQRKVVKHLMASLFFREKAALRLPKGISRELPEGWSMERFKAAASAFHPAIAHLFDTDIGFELMATESEILVGILLELASKGIAALPMHDGIMVGAGHNEFAIETMQKVSESKAGRILPVVEKPILQPANNSPLWSTSGVPLSDSLIA
ncbi:hypothetical protein [Rhizobium sp. BK376]|uniref:hypothetical protein n=1 Tax=Rhizobium sp. BK376 TaxID=2512149 RepID=UPI001050D30E|nr:hypothetical protein [Rhizobium sp. BK376]TCR69605.1 hypothetical protein EV561_13931 [Rhizobium sp. BK376]